MDPFNPQIKEAYSSDSLRIKDFVLGVLKELGFTYSQKLDKDLVNPSKFYKDHRGIFYVLYDHSHIIGCVAVKQVDNDKFEIKRLYIDKTYRGRGLGERLLDEVISFCKNANALEVVLDTNKEFHSAIKLYKKKGFQIVKEDESVVYMSKKF